MESICFMYWFVHQYRHLNRLKSFSNSKHCRYTFWVTKLVMNVKYFSSRSNQSAYNIKNRRFSKVLIDSNCHTPVISILSAVYTLHPDHTLTICLSRKQIRPFSPNLWTDSRVKIAIISPRVQPKYIYQIDKSFLLDPTNVVAENYKTRKPVIIWSHQMGFGTCHFPKSTEIRHGPATVKRRMSLMPSHRTNIHSHLPLKVDRWISGRRPYKHLFQQNVC